MGFAEPDRMRAGLQAVRDAPAATVGTITVDSFTRLNQHTQAAAALRRGEPLNGYPIVAHSSAVTRRVVDGLLGPEFPVQVRHGSPQPRRIIEATIKAGIRATEGGPVSYCLPYGRTPLRIALSEWRASCQILGAAGCHLESFGGCMLGQLCPPSLLLAIGVLEGMFFRAHGVTSISLSYTQQTNRWQDIAAIRSLRRLAADHLPDIDLHVVMYTAMGVYPQTRTGADRALAESVVTAVIGGAERLIVKTRAEAYGLPSIEENIAAITDAAQFARTHASPPPTVDGLATRYEQEVHGEAKTLIGEVLSLDDDVGRAIAKAFRAGVLDIPYCVHPDNRGLSRSVIDEDGCLRWVAVGQMPIARSAITPASEVTADRMLDMLTYTRRRFDQADGV